MTTATVIVICLLALILVIQVFDLLLRRNLRNMMLTHLEETRALTTATKEWARSGRTHNVEAGHTLKAVKQIAESAPSIAQAVEALPERTAEEVAKKLSGDSGIHG